MRKTTGGLKAATPVVHILVGIRGKLAHGTARATRRPEFPLARPLGTSG